MKVTGMMVGLYPLSRIEQQYKPPMIQFQECYVMKPVKLHDTDYQTELYL